MSGQLRGYNPVFVGLMGIWTGLLAVVAILTAFFCLGFGMIVFPPLILLFCCFAALHILLVWRVVDRRRWAWVLTAFLGLLYLWFLTAFLGILPWSRHFPGPFEKTTMGVLVLVMTLVVARWRELEPGW
jgi:hypothetical protein